MKSFTMLTKELFVKGSIMAFQAEQYIHHVTGREKDWLCCEEKDKCLGEKAQYEHDRRLHQFLESCAMEEKPNVDLLDNDETFTAIENRRFSKMIELPP